MDVLCLQDVSGGQPVPVEGTALPLWGLEIDPDRATDEFRAFNARDDGKVSLAWVLTCWSPCLLHHLDAARV